MTPAARAAAYWHQTGRVMSKRQQKRYRRKALRGPSLLDFAPSDATSLVSDGVSPTPARDPKSGSGVVDEMDPSPSQSGSVPGGGPSGVPREAGHHT